jgi:hypothetical protein
MRIDEINALFQEAIKEEAVYNKLQGITRNQIYNWNNNRGVKPPSLGNKLHVLYQLNKIEIKIK